MNRSAVMPAVIAVLAVAFAAGLFSSLALAPSAASAEVSSLPPIFLPGNTVTFGSQGPHLTIVQVYNDWIFVDQNRLGGFPVSTDEDTNNDNRFWLYVPQVDDSWRLVQQAQ